MIFQELFQFKYQEKQALNKKISIKRMRKMAAWDLEYLNELIKF